MTPPTGADAPNGAALGDGSGRAAEGITPRDKDPEAYVEEKKTSKASATAEKAAGKAKKAAKTAPASSAPSKKASPDASEEE